MRISLERTQEKIRMKLEVEERDEGSVTSKFQGIDQNLQETKRLRYFHALGTEI